MSQSESVSPSLLELASRSRSAEVSELPLKVESVWKSAEVLPSRLERASGWRLATGSKSVSGLPSLSAPPWRSRSAASVNAATPVVVGDTIFVSATYGTGAAALRVQGQHLTEIWSGDEVLSNHYATSVYSNGYLYGFHGRQEFNPSFRAVDLQTGAVAWNVDAFHAGSVTLAGDQLLILKETGELILAAATPQAYRPLTQARILPATVRSLPALADGFLYARNNDTHTDVLVCLDLR